VKKIIILSIFFIAAVVSAQTATQKIGYVDSEIILAQYPAAIKAKSDLDGLVAKWRKEADSMGVELQKSYADYQQKVQMMKQEEQQKAQQVIVEKEQKIQVFREQKFGQPNGEYFTRQDQLMKPVKEKVFQAIDDVRTEEGMSFVFDKVGDTFLLSADAQFDLTFKVLDRLKRGK
jgi:outer membrane protein